MPRVWEFPGGRGEIDERLSDKQIKRIEDAFTRFEKNHPVEGIWGLGFEFSQHYYGKKGSGWDVIILAVTADYFAQINVDIYGNGDEWFYAHELDPIHGDHEDFRDEECDEPDDD